MKKIFPLLLLMTICMHSGVFLQPANADFSLRSVLNDNTCAPSVSISITPLETTSSYAVTEKIPFDLFPVNINENGQWHPEEQKIRWGNFRDHTARSLSYDLSGINATYELSEIIFSADGQIETMTSSTSVSIQCTQTQDPDESDPDTEIPLDPIPQPLFMTNSQTVPASLSITSSIQNAYVYYTTDGTRPTTASPLFLGTIDIEKPAIIRAINTKTGMAKSSVSEIRLGFPVYQPAVIQSVYNNDSCVPSITINITPVQHTKTYALETILPTGLTPLHINENGIWQQDTGMIRWGNFHDDTARSFSFTLTGNNGEYSFSRMIYSEDGNAYELTQTALLTMNCPSNTQTIEDPQDSPEPEIIEMPIIHTISDSDPFEFSISCHTPDTIIYYTTDGTRPTKNSLIYTNPVSISRSSSIRAIAIKEDTFSSDTACYQYFLTPTVQSFGNVNTQVENNESCQPKISLSIDPEQDIQSYAVELLLPQGVHPYSITGEGVHNYSQNTIRWGNFRDISLRDFSFQLNGNTQDALITGIVGFDGNNLELPGIPVSIACTENEMKTLLSVAPLNVTISANATTLPITITDLFNTGIMNWEITSQADWITVIDLAFGTGNTVRLIHCSLNDTLHWRSGKVIIQSTDKSEYVEIFQMPNQPPTAHDGTHSLDEDKHLNILLEATDSDSLSYTFADRPSHGKAVISGDIALYTPDKDYYGMDRFSFKANDGVSDSNTAHIVLTILPIDDPPIAKDISFQTTENRECHLTFPETDVDGEQLTVNFNQPEHGFITQQFTYVPDQWFWGTDTFLYSLSDSKTTKTATVTVTVDRSKEYTLTITTETDANEIIIDGQSISELPWQKAYSPGKQVRLEALSTPNLKFEKWVENFISSSTENPLTITMSKGKTISPYFVPPKHKLSLLGYPYHAVIINGDKYSLPVEKIFNQGSLISIKAIPHDLFTGFSGNYIGNTNPIVFSIQSDMTIGVLFKDPKEWSMTVTAETVDLPQTYTDEIKIGVSLIAASQNYHFPEEYYGCSLWTYSSDWKKLSQSIQTSQRSENSWIIAINPHGDIGPPDPRTSVLRWNPEQFSETGCYRMYRGHDHTGEIVVSDMRKSNEYAVTGCESVQTYTIVWSKQFTETIHLFTKLGWNLIALPVKPLNSDAKVLFPDETLYEFKDNTYIIAEKMKVGKGYWLNATQESYEITGEPVESYTLKRHSGWHLIGALKNQESNPFSDDCVEEILSYENNSYTDVSEFVPGKGYFLKMR
ncbi:MAG: chitobiase/beta-hexosaminidase C-terminal domain-containing protein [Candidatus Magnetomorum sp.]|nr:chitobiase/beta-hexosaminidase C-terminal domain-containing protein [Candidatus Magnetomorum sp.]